MREARAISLSGGPDRDDGELARAATEDRGAFAATCERHRTPVDRYLRVQTATDADAQGLAATTFERAIGAIHRFQPVGGGMVAWLIRIPRNAHSDALRQQRRRGAEVASDAGEPALDASDDAAVLRSPTDGLPSQMQGERGLRAPKEAYGAD